MPILPLRFKDMISMLTMADDGDDNSKVKFMLPFPLFQSMFLFVLSYYLKMLRLT